MKLLSTVAGPDTRAHPTSSEPGPGDHGRDRVARSLLHEGPGTAASVAARLGISATAVRRHLDALQADGLVEGRERPPYGPAPRRGRGRPARVFALTSAGRESFPDGYGQLALEAVQYLSEHGGDAAVTAFARARADQLSAALRQRLGTQWEHAAAQPRLVALADALSDLGFAASVDPAPTGAQLCQHNCPVAKVAERFPQLCEAETEAFADLLGHHVQRLATMAHGAGVCTTVVPASPDERTSA